MDQITALKIEYEFNGRKGVIYPVVLKDETNMVLIDGGFIGFLPMLEKAMQENHLECSELTHVLITHHDHDHIGALAALKAKYPQIKVVSSELEEPYISGKRKSLRLEQAEARQPFLPEDQKAFGEQFCELIRRVVPVQVDQTVNDGDIFPWCGGSEIVGTPGHTPGHIAVYVSKLKTMITGDAAALENGKLIIANPQYTLDMEEAQRSIEKMSRYDFDQIICYHGGSMKKQE